jgi:hypothetical protein
MYQDELSREAKVFVQGLQYILEDTSALLRRVAARFRFRH